jgi:biopolymer transport protein TolR
MTRIPRGAAQFKWRRQRQEKARRRPVLNLVALMDVFTILVFFFLVHSPDSAPQAYSERVMLPESIADQSPGDTPVVTITPDTILLQGEPVVSVDALLRASDGVSALHTALQAELATEAAPELTIVGDRSIPFALLDRVLRICTQAGYGNISLSVLQRTTGAG